MGRKFIRHADGRIGPYRKTLVRRARRATSPRPALKPDERWTLSFTLPGMLALGLGFYPGPIGVKFWPPDRITVEGANADFCLRQMFDLLAKLAPDGLPVPIEMQWTPPARTSKWGKAQDFVRRAIWDGKHRTVMHHTAMREVA